jgi:hypothetical protein
MLSMLPMMSRQRNSTLEVWSLRFLFATISLIAVATNAAEFGPLLHDFPLTLSAGHRTEFLGPFFYSEEKESQRTWAIPPLMSDMKDAVADIEEFDFLYPLVTYDRYGSQHRLQFFQLLSFSGGPTQLEEKHKHFTIFPLYFQQRGSDTTNNYTALVPFYGQLKHRLFKDEIFFVMFPIYSQTRKKGVVTDNYVYPFFHLRHGDGLSGWQFWPIVGREHKVVTIVTNRFGDPQTVGGHDKFFVLWPFYFNEFSDRGTDHPEHLIASFPFYSQSRSPKRDVTSVCLLFSHEDDREKKYREWDLPWPLVVRARGEGKTMTRFLPFYSYGFNTNLQTDAILWPVYKHYHFHSDTLERDRKQVCYFAYSHLSDKNVQTGAVRSRTDLLPLYHYRRDFNGNTRLQIIAPLEVFVAGAHKIERDYSPIWSVWRAEHNAKTGASSQSLLWNLYRHDATPETKKTSFLFGLFQTESKPEGKRVRLFYIPVTSNKN